MRYQTLIDNVYAAVTPSLHFVRSSHHLIIVVHTNAPDRYVAIYYLLISQPRTQTKGVSLKLVLSCLYKGVIVEPALVE